MEHTHATQTFAKTRFGPRRADRARAAGHDRHLGTGARPPPLRSERPCARPARWPPRPFTPSWPTCAARATWSPFPPRSASMRLRPKVARERVAGRPLRELLRDYFGGSASRLMAHLIRERSVDAEELAEIRRLLDSKKDEQGEVTSDARFVFCSIGKRLACDPSHAGAAGVCQRRTGRPRLGRGAGDPPVACAHTSGPGFALAIGAGQAGPGPRHRHAVATLALGEACDHR